MNYGRVHWFEPDELDADQRWFYDLVMAGPREKDRISDAKGRLTGAFNARLLHPKVGAAIQQISADIRFGSSLTLRETELVILEVSRVEKCSFEFIAHAQLARRGGMGDVEIEALRTGTKVPGLDETEEAVLRLARSLSEKADLSDELFQDVTRFLDLPKIFDIVSLAGHYKNTAMALRVWRVPLRDGDQPLFGEDPLPGPS